MYLPLSLEKPVNLLGDCRQRLVLYEIELSEDLDLDLEAVVANLQAEQMRLERLFH